MRLKMILLFAFVFYCLNEGTETPLLAYEQNPRIARTNHAILSCKEVKARIETMLILHFQFNELNNDLAKRAIIKLFESLNPEKIYFLKSDILNFKSDIKKNLNENECGFIFDVKKILKSRVMERNLKIKNILSTPIDLKKTEYINITKKNWSESEYEANEKIRKKIKLQFLTNKENEESEKLVRVRLQKSYERFEKNIESINTDKLFHIFLNSFAISLDPHSIHMMPTDHESFIIHISNKLEGIGTQLQEKDGYIIIRSLVPGASAEKMGKLQVNDKILAVDINDGKGFYDLLDASVEDAVNLIRGKKGTTLKLLIQRNTENIIKKFPVTLVRDEIELKDELVKTEIVNLENKKIGIIKIPSFYTDLKCKSKFFLHCKGVSYDVEKELKKLSQEKVDGILIDLRNNGGGDFPESLRLTGFFLPQGTAVQTKDKNQSIRSQTIEKSKSYYMGPLVVLINKLSASASEIFVGAVQDYGRGIIVGDKNTFGKATVQIIQEIPGIKNRKTDGALKITQSKFYRPAGESNQKYGVLSNIIIPNNLEIYEIGENFLDYALSKDAISPSKNFKPMQNLSVMINKLNKLSQDRINKDKKFQELNAKIKMLKLAKNKPIAITKENIKLIEELESPKFYLEKKNFNKKVVSDDDLQLQEALKITLDTINLSKDPAYLSLQN
ncbi:carboxy terminal-processing peptidase [Spirobacillus cienkowskii]|uniref:carboxy terminal-processing peptidase n=1 Tax=Spirobacillus cienkowskii TaxID=495820 RepID=UPI0030CCD80E